MRICRLWFFVEVKAVVLRRCTLAGQSLSHLLLWLFGFFVVSFVVSLKIHFTPFWPVGAFLINLGCAIATTWSSQHPSYSLQGLPQILMSSSGSNRLSHTNIEAENLDEELTAWREAHQPRIFHPPPKEPSLPLSGYSRSTPQVRNPPTSREATKPLYLRALRSMYAGSFVLSLLVASTCAI